MEITEIKQLLSLSEVIRHYGFKADKQNRLHCPFHEDKTPSMQLYYKTQTAYCFSSNCRTHGKSMDVIDFIMYKENCSKHEAIEKANTLVGNEKLIVNKERNKPVYVEETSVLAKSQFLENLFQYFCNAIHNSKPAQEYLQSRCLDYQKTKVGYNSGQFHHGARKDETLIAQCLEYGLLLDKGNKSRIGEKAYTVFGKWCICFALRNAEDHITSLYFRSTLSDKEQRHFYIKDRSGLYPNYPNPNTTKLILTESIIDAATLLQQEEIKTNYEVLALYGTNGLTGEHQKAIRDLVQLKEIIFFLNGDQPGEKAVAKYAPMFKSEYPALTITSVQVPEDEDVNSLLQGHTTEVLTHLIDTRKECEFTEIEPAEEPTFSFSSEEPVHLLPEVPQGTEITVTEKENSQLDVNNPYNLKYQGNEAFYQIKGFRVEQPDSLKITLQIAPINRTSNQLTTKLDLYEYKQVESTCRLAAEKLSLRKEAVEADLQRLTNLLEHYRDSQQYKAQGKTTNKTQVPPATATRCFEFLKQPDLIRQINELIGKSGIIGEETNRILLFVIASSYKMPDTLHGLIQGSSGSGKTRLQKVVSYLMPDEDVKRYTRVTDNSFYNQDEYFFVNKLLCFEDLDGLKEDAQLAVRELQSNEILITSTSIKDSNGSIRGGERTVRGPIASLSCTTKGEIYEDNVSRSFLIAVDESRTQTMKIIDYQNDLSAGLIDKVEQKKISAFLQNCIRLLKPYEVVNPFANKIRLPEEAHKIRRLNELYQSFVKQITLLNQYQRKQDHQGRLITQKEDLQTACHILFESILLKVDELDGSLRQFYEKLKSFVEKKGRDYAFNRFEVREATGVSKTQQHYYLQKLVMLEYLKQSGFANRGFTYKISHWDNMSSLRTRIKDSLDNQLEQL